MAFNRDNRDRNSRGGDRGGFRPRPSFSSRGRPASGWDSLRLYKSSIAGVTGHNPPDPWDLTDGVVAMALKLTKVDGVKQHKRSAEAKAYCIYLAGGNWAAYCDNKGANYGEKVLYWADNYERVMN